MTARTALPYPTKRLKHIVSPRQSRVNGNGGESLYVGLENIEPWTGKLFESLSPATMDDTVQSNVFSPGDVLFGKLRPYLAKVWVAEFAGRSTTECLVMKPVEVESRFLGYACLRRDFIDAGPSGALSGICASRFRIGVGSVPSPTISTAKQPSWMRWSKLRSKCLNCWRKGVKHLSTRGCIPFSWVGRRHDRPSNRGSRASACFRSSIWWRARRWLPPACRPRARESELRRRRRPFLGIFPDRPYCSIRRPQLGRKASRSASATARPTGTKCAATSAAHADCRSDPASRKRLQAHRREPVRTIGMTPVEAASKTAAGPK